MSLKKPSVYPDLTSEANLGFFASKAIIGVDEVGRGCLAGSVVAAAAMLHQNAGEQLHFFASGARPKKKLPAAQKHLEVLLEVRDSKLIPEPARAPLAEAVKAFVRGYEIGEASVDEIETLNILYASHLAMERAVFGLEKKLGLKADFILVDGNLVPRAFLGRGHPLIKGDQKSFTIACASIIAKVYRDQMMHDLDLVYPGYGLKEHKGYSTPHHKRKIQELGATKIHRMSFRGVRAEIADDQMSLEIG